MAKVRTGTVTGAAACLAAMFLGAVPAQAHPHVWVTVKAELVYEGPNVTAVRHVWSFDPAYSAFVTQGLDRNKDGKLSRDELAELAKVNTESLVDYDYFTMVRAGGAKQAFGTPRDESMSFADGIATLSFVLPLKAPAAGRTVGVEIFDPTYFVSFTMSEGDDALRLANAPGGCAVNVTRPKAPDAAQQSRLSETFFDQLGPGTNFGAQFANKAVIACP
jgi:ABC-type uncharacterized transport system substrate-binding protein